MKNTLSPQASVWTRWHQQRLLESEMIKDLSKAPNQKYIAVSRFILILTVVCMYVDCEGDCSWEVLAKAIRLGHEADWAA